LLPLIFANTTALAMTRCGPCAGNASTIIGVIQFGLAGLASSLVSVFHDGTAGPMVGLLFACAALALGVQGFGTVRQAVARLKKRRRAKWQDVTP
jgi:DHA1 family bicyclomycin/chloramphenicol resistance-like MFS transporter